MQLHRQSLLRDRSSFLLVSLLWCTVAIVAARIGTLFVTRSWGVWASKFCWWWMAVMWPLPVRTCLLIERFQMVGHDRAFIGRLVHEVVAASSLSASAGRAHCVEMFSPDQLHAQAGRFRTATALHAAAALLPDHMKNCQNCRAFRFDPGF